jgi:hypothetical protein
MNTDVVLAFIIAVVLLVLFTASMRSLNVVRRTSPRRRSTDVETTRRGPAE